MAEYHRRRRRTRRTAGGSTERAGAPGPDEGAERPDSDGKPGPVDQPARTPRDATGRAEAIGRRSGRSGGGAAARRARGSAATPVPQPPRHRQHPVPAPPADTGPGGGTRQQATTEPGRSRRRPRRGADEATEGERGLRGLVGAGSSQVSISAALRARDAARPTEEELAAAERDLPIVRRHWVPRDPRPPV